MHELHRQIVMERTFDERQPIIRTTHRKETNLPTLSDHARAHKIIPFLIVETKTQPEQLSAMCPQRG